MSSEWPTRPLGELTVNHDGRRRPVKESERQAGPFPYYGASGVVDHVDGYLFDGEYLLVGEDGENLRTRQTPIAFLAIGKFWVNNHAHIVTGNGIASTRYLLYALLGSDISSYLTGAVMPKLTQGNLNRLIVPCPPRPVQDAIVSVLGALDDRIALLRETNATLEAIAQALFKSWFVDFDPVRAKQQGLAPTGMDEATAALFPDSFEESALGLVPTGWRVQRLGEVVSRVTKGTTPTTLKRPFVPAGINFVKAESMTDDGGFIPEKFAFIDAETHELLRRSQLEAGDVLISIAGTIGRTAVMTSDFLPANTNQAVALIRPLPEVFPSGLLVRFLQRSDSRQLMGERVVQAVQANLSLGTLSDLMVVLPPPDVTRKLHETLLSQVDASKALNQQRTRTLATLRDTLLPRLISGQLRLPEAEAAMRESIKEGMAEPLASSARALDG
jgi:type I restriction enzyme, S subunit